MKLSEIVNYLNLIDSLDIYSEAGDAVRKMSAVIHAIVNHALQFENCSQDLQNNFNQVISGLDDFSANLLALKQHLVRVVQHHEPAMLAESFRLFDQEMRHDSSQYILSRRLGIDDEANIALRSRLKNLTDWRLPGMVIGPRNETFVEDLVPLDPLYLVDHNSELLTPAVQKFTTEYQNRLRQYVVNDYAFNTILHELPNNQFGVVFAYGYFNFRPMEIISKYLTEIAQKLRPGGTFIMTYNNCDRAHGIGLAERSWMCYTPKRLVLLAAEKAGLEYVSDTDANGDLSWIEFCRPGEIESLRGGQTLAKIIAIPQ